MCADDVVCTGAEPLAFLDYVAVGRLDPVGVAELVGGVAAGCREAGAALVGGETAEHPGLLEADEFDLAGCCIGVVERSRVIDGCAVVAGDVDPGAALVRAARQRLLARAGLIAQWDLDLGRAVPGPRLRRTLGDAATDEALAAAPHETMATLGEVLLTPTRIYARAVLAAARARRRRPRPPRPRPHHRRRPARERAAGAARRARRALDPTRWTMPSVMRLFGALGGLDDDELRATFNGGLGMVVVVPGGRRPRSRPGTASTAMAAEVVGEVVAAASSAGRRYVEGALERSRERRTRIAVGVSGAGSNLRALQAAAARGELGGEIVLVFADRPARRSTGRRSRGSRPRSSPAATTRRWPRRSAARGPDVVVLAGYMRLVGPSVLAAFRGRILNTHPSLLPAFPGAMPSATRWRTAGR